MRTSICLLALLPAVAQAHEGDIAITRLNSQIVTGLGDHSFYPNVFEFPERVFAVELEMQSGFIFTDEPGWLGPFDNVGEGFQPGTALGFNIRKAVRRWTGDDFLAGPAAEQMRLYDSGAGTNQAHSPLFDQSVSGFAVVANAAAHATGGFDEHPFYELTTNTPGIYLLELEIWASDPSVQTSLPFWIVFNWDSSEFEHDQAIDWTVANLVPAPTSGVVVLGGMMLLARRRR